MEEMCGKKLSERDSVIHTQAKALVDHDYLHVMNALHNTTTRAHTMV
jgi:hypothetical protein